MALEHDALMKLAIGEAELARGSTGDNPWVGCVIVDAGGEILARGHTQGPGEDHAEIAALRHARGCRFSAESATMYSTLEPCSFHARTPACSRVIVESGIRRVVIGMRDPHPRVDGQGARILRDAGVEVIEGVCERDVRRQLGVWVLQFHPHEPLRRARELAPQHTARELVGLLADTYAIEPERAQQILATLERVGESA